MQQRKEVMSFTKTIAAGTSETLSERVKSDGTVEEIRVRFYPGQEGSLHVRPYVNSKPSNIIDLVSYPSGANAYLSGDDDTKVYPVSLGVRYDDEIRVWVDNTSAYDYTLSVDVVVDYLGGQIRVV